MDDAFAVRLFEPVDDLHGDRRRLPPGDRARAMRCASVSPSTRSSTRYGEPSEPLEAVDRRDVRMAHRGEHARLALEAAQAARIAAEGVAQRLDRDFASEARIERAIDGAHAAGAEQIEDLIASEMLAGDEGRVVLVFERFATTRRPAAPVRHVAGSPVLGHFLDRAHQVREALAQRPVANAGVVDKPSALVRRAIERRPQQCVETIAVAIVLTHNRSPGA